MSKITDWMNEEAERLENEQSVSEYQTVNHSFIQGFYYAQAHIEILEKENEDKATQYRKAIQKRIVGYNMSIAKISNELLRGPSNILEMQIAVLNVKRAEALDILEELKNIDKNS